MTTTLKDLVCGMMIDPETAFTTREHEGQKFYFCSQDCADKFDADSHKYGHTEGSTAHE